jgi:hypothetical protein
MVRGVRRSRMVDTQAEAIALRDQILRDGWPADNAPTTDPVDPNSDEAGIHTVADVLALHIGDLTGRGCFTAACVKSMVRVWERDRVAGAAMLATPVAALTLARLTHFFDLRATESRTATGGTYKTTSILREYRTLHAALKPFRRDLEWPSLAGKDGWKEGESGPPPDPLPATLKKQLLLALAEPYRTVVQLGIWLNPRRANFTRMEQAHCHLDIPKPYLHLPKTKTRKRGEIVPLVPPAVKLLRAQIARHPGSRWLFPSPWKNFTTPLKGSDLYKKFKAAAVAIGRPTLRFHDLRHQFASELLANGYSPGEIAKAGRWKRAHEIYMHQADEHAREMLLSLTADGHARRRRSSSGG